MFSMFEEESSPFTCGGNSCLKRQRIYLNDVAASWSKSILESGPRVLPLGPLAQYLVSAQWCQASLPGWICVLAAVTIT